jgi:hypothetical protein
MKKFKINKRLMALHVCACAVFSILAVQVLATCPGDDLPDCPGGCGKVFALYYYSCSTDGTSCCQYHNFKYYCTGGGCPEFIVRRYLIGTFSSSTCQQPSGQCTGFNPPD